MDMWKDQIQVLEEKKITLRELWGFEISKKQTKVTGGIKKNIGQNGINKSWRESKNSKSQFFLSKSEFSNTPKQLTECLERLIWGENEIQEKNI